MIRARYSFRFFFFNIFPRALEFSVLSVFAWAGDEVNLRTCKTWRLKFPRIECQRLEIRVKRNTFVFYISSLFLLYFLGSVCQSFTGSNILPKFIFKISFLWEISSIHLCTAVVFATHERHLSGKIFCLQLSLFVFLVWDGRNVLS